MVVVTLRSLAEDIRLLCNGRAQVIPIPPAGVDPHVYSLKPRDYEHLRQADVIVTTLHTPSEHEIDSLVRQGELKPKAYIVAYSVPGVRLLENPITGKPNLHGFVYDPENYIALIRYVASTLASLDEAGGSLYIERARALEARVLDALRGLDTRRELVGVASTPIAQYVGGMLKIKLALVLVGDPEAPPTPKAVKQAFIALKEGIAAVALVSGVVDRQGEIAPYAAPDKALLELARNTGTPVIVIPPPVINRPVIETIEMLAREYASIANLEEDSAMKTERALTGGTGLNMLLLLALGAIVLVAAGIAYKASLRRGT